MNPVDPKDQSGFDLPAPGQPIIGSGGIPIVPNNNPISRAPSGSPTPNPVNSHPISPVPNRTTQPAAMPVMDDSNPAVAEDNDLIEQEWVDKAKAIVEHTKEDPYKQNLEMNKMKADYIKKRYGKDVKAPNE